MKPSSRRPRGRRPGFDSFERRESADTLTTLPGFEPHLLGRLAGLEQVSLLRPFVYLAAIRPAIVRMIDWNVAAPGESVAHLLA